MADPECTVPRYAAAEAFESALGDARDPRSPFSFRRAVELDELEAFPQETFEGLARTGILEAFIPEAHGGTFVAMDENLFLNRLIARRDLTVDVGLGQNVLGALAVWMEGDAAQKAKVAAILRAGGFVSMGLTERAHGSDLLATELTARDAGDGTLVLSGEKWLINNATLSRGLSLLVRVEGGAFDRSLALVFVDKADLVPGTFAYLPKNRTHGIRGADISGIAFNGSPISATSFIGTPQRGLQTTLRLLQVTRTLCASLTLGAVDTALRATLDFARNRRLYRGTVLDIPFPRRLILDAFVDHLVNECVALAACRTLHVAPGQMSIASAVTKYWVPKSGEGALDKLGMALGARHFLRDGHWDGVFQKMLRDNAVVGLFDGSSAVNLAAIAAQLGDLAGGAQTRSAPGREDDRAANVFAPCEPLPAMNLAGLTLGNGGADLVVESLFDAPRALRAISHVRIDGEAAALALELIEFFVARLHAHNQAMLAGGKGPRELHRPPERFEAAIRYAALYAAAACIGTWIYGGEALGTFAASPSWLLLCLSRLRRVFDAEIIAYPVAAEREVEARLLELADANRLFSLAPLRLGSRSDVVA